jgi:hypothetical protein
VIWACLALSVVLADVSIHWKEILSALSASPVPVKSGASTNAAKPGLAKNAVGAT